MHPFQVRFLIPESIATMQHLLKTQPLTGAAILIGTFLVVLGILRKVFGRITTDLLIFAVIIYVMVTLFGSAAYTIIHMKGFHLGG